MVTVLYSCRKAGSYDIYISAFVETVKLSNCISYFPSDRVFFLNQTNIWHFQTLNVCQSVYKILLHYHLINIFLNSRAIENFVNSLLTILAIIFFTNFSISFFFFFFWLFLIDVQKSLYFLESNSFFCFIYCNTIQ